MFGLFSKLFGVLTKPMKSIKPMSKAFAIGLLKDAIPSSTIGIAMIATGEHVDELGKSIANSLGR